jgi:CheY-like chemotaxis protein
VTEALAFVVGLLLGSALTAMFVKRRPEAPQPAPAPQPPARDVEAPVRSVAPPPPPLSPSDGGVLVVDDDQLVRNFLQRGLTRRGERPILAETGEEAQAILSSTPGIRAVLLDLGLNIGPMSGDEVLAWAVAMHPEIPVFIITGSDPEMLKSSGRLQGAAGVLQKPFSIDDVLERLRAR